MSNEPAPFDAAYIHALRMGFRQDEARGLTPSHNPVSFLNSRWLATVDEKDAEIIRLREALTNIKDESLRYCATHEDVLREMDIILATAQVALRPSSTSHEV